jgi:hypothetical protein
VAPVLDHCLVLDDRRRIDDGALTDSRGGVDDGACCDNRARPDLDVARDRCARMDGRRQTKALEANQLRQREARSTISKAEDDMLHPGPSQETQLLTPPNDDRSAEFFVVTPWIEIVKKADDLVVATQSYDFRDDSRMT